MSAHKGKFISYHRVSTDKQGKNGLGLDAQRVAVADYLDGGEWSWSESSLRWKVASAATDPNW